MSLLYISSILPARSETFVYREVFALRARGLIVHTASVNAPERALGEPRLEALADSAIPVYSAGPWPFLRDLAIESLTHPLRTLRTTLRSAADILTCDDVPWPRRPRLAVQTLAGLVLARRIQRLNRREADRRGRDFQPDPQAPQECGQFNPDPITHIHAHMAHVPTTIAMVAARQLGIPFSFTGHANDIFPNRALLRTKLRRAAFVSCISRWHRAFYHDLTGVPLDRLPVIRCGVDVPAVRFAPWPDQTAPASPSTIAIADKGVVPSSPTHPHKPFHILAVGRLIRKKGFDVLLDALRELMRRRPDLAGTIHLTIVGDGPEMSALSTRAANLPASMPATSGPRVTLLGAQPNTRVRDLMHDADLFVLPCRVDPAGDRDGIPVVLMEAMAVGVPVISGRLPAIEELVEHEATGLMVPPGEPDALTDAIERLMTDADLSTRLAVAGRQRVIDEFSESVNIDRLLVALGLHRADHASDRPDGTSLDPRTAPAPSAPPPRAGKVSDEALRV